MDPRLFHDENIDVLIASGLNLDKSAHISTQDDAFINTSIDGISGMIGIPPSHDHQIDTSNKEQHIPALFVQSILHTDSGFDIHPAPDSAHSSLFPSTETFTTLGENQPSDNVSPSAVDQLSDLFSPNLPITSFSNLEISPGLESQHQQHFLTDPSQNNPSILMNLLDPSIENLIRVPSPIIPFIPSPMSSPLVTVADPIFNSIPGQSLDNMSSFLDMNGFLNGLNSLPKSFNDSFQELGLGLDPTVDHTATKAHQTMTLSTDIFGAEASFNSNPLFTVPSSSTDLAGSSSTESLPSIATSLNDFTFMSSTVSQLNDSSADVSTLLSPPVCALRRRASNGNLAVPKSSNVIRHARSRSASYALVKPSQNTTMPTTGPSAAISKSRAGPKRRVPEQDRPAAVLEGIQESVPSGRFWNKIQPENAKPIFQCPFPGCGNTFTRTTNLKSHYQATHTNERPFICEECGSSFVRKHDFNRHKIGHQTIKPHVCPLCDKGFTRSDALKRHLKPKETGKESRCAIKLKMIEILSRGIPKLGTNTATSSSTGSQPTNQSSESLTNSSLFEIPVISQEQIQALFGANEQPSSQDAAEAETSSTIGLPEILGSLERLQQGIYSDEWVQKIVNIDLDQLFALPDTAT